MKPVRLITLGYYSLSHGDLVFKFFSLVISSSSWFDSVRCHSTQLFWSSSRWRFTTNWENYKNIRKKSWRFAQFGEISNELTVWSELLWLLSNPYHKPTAYLCRLRCVSVGDDNAWRDSRVCDGVGFVWKYSVNFAPSRDFAWISSICNLAVYCRVKQLRKMIKKKI